MESEGGGGVGSTRRQRFNRVKAVVFLTGMVLFVKLANFVIIKNFISYLMGEMHVNLKATAEYSNYAEGTALIAPVAGAIVAHSYVGCRFAMTMMSSAVYALGLGLLVMSELIPTLKALNTFIISMCLVYIGIGILSPCLKMIGNDQFDENRPQIKTIWTFLVDFIEIILTGSLSFSLLVWGKSHTYLFIFISMMISIVIFYYGKTSYRHVIPSQNPTYHVNLRMLIILWLTCAMFGLFRAQTSTLFAIQSSQLTTTVVKHGTEIPPTTFYFVSIVGVKIVVVLLEKVVLPIIPTTQNLRISILKRMVVGMVITVGAMTAAALVEKKRQIALSKLPHTNRRDIGPDPLSILWILPQGMLLGLVDAFFENGIGEYFADHQHSFATEFYTSAVGIGSFLSGMVIRAVGHLPVTFIGIDLKSSRLDRFYWLLTGLSIFGLVILTTVILTRRFPADAHEEISERNE